jgi:hypothetical protein
MMQYSSQKIIVAKLAERIEAFFDEEGRYAALNVNFVFAAGVEAYFYLGQMNSRLLSWVYRQIFGALTMGGDYLQIQAPQLRAMLIVPYSEDAPQHQEVASLARQASLCPDDATLLDAIDLAVSGVLGLSSEDLATILRRPHD